MIVRIRLDLGSKRRRGQRSNYGVALAAAALLSPAALVAFVLGAWSLGADLGWTGEFGIRQGIFARWQTWLIISMLMQIAALGLNRYGSRESEVSMP
jgi:hypothetical protein